MRREYHAASLSYLHTVCFSLRQQNYQLGHAQQLYTQAARAVGLGYEKRLCHGDIHTAKMQHGRYQHCAQSHQLPIGKHAQRMQHAGLHHAGIPLTVRPPSMCGLCNDSLRYSLHSSSNAGESNASATVMRRISVFMPATVIGTCSVTRTPYRAPRCLASRP